MSLACTVAAIATLVCFYPGFMTNDSYDSLKQARSFQFADWHPVAMALIWRLTDSVVSGPFGLLALQTALFWTGIFLWSRSIDGPQPGLRRYALVLTALWPPVFSVMGGVWKDALMASFLMLAVGLLANDLTGRRTGTKALHVTLAAAALFVASSLRLNGIVAVVPLLFFLFHRRLGLRQRYLAGVATLAAAAGMLLLTASITSALKPDRRSTWQALAMFDIAGIVVNHPTALPFALDAEREQIRVFLRSPATARRDIPDFYWPRQWAILAEPPNGPFQLDYNQDMLLRLRRMWIQMILRNPSAWLSHRWKAFREVIGIPVAYSSSVDSKFARAPLKQTPGLFGWLLWEPVLYSPHGDSYYPSELKHEYSLSRFQVALISFFRMAVRWGVYQPVIYLLLAIGAAVSCVLGRTRLDSLGMGVLLSGILLELSLFVAGPSNDFRYSHWMITSTCLACASMLVIRPSSQGHVPRGLSKDGREPTPPAVRVGLTVVLALLAGAGACQTRDAAPPVATVTFSASKTRIAPGNPVEFTYQFDVAPEAKFEGDYRVFTHVIDGDGHGTSWNDDHAPAVPTSQWKPGQTVKYTRTSFVPVIPYVGEVTVEAGLYKGSERLPLGTRPPMGTAPRSRAYPVGRLQLVQPSESDDLVVVRRSGWHQTEHDDGGESAWTQKSAIFGLASNPHKDITLYLQYAARPEVFDGRPQTVTLSVGTEVVAQFIADSAEVTLRRIPVSAAQLGNGESPALFRLDVDRTFVPAALPGGGTDTRELGLRVLHCFIEVR